MSDDPAGRGDAREPVRAALDGLDAGLVRRLTAQFLESYPGQLADLAAAVEGGDLDRAAFGAHKLRGSLTLFRAAAAADLAEALETSAERGDRDRALACLARLRRAVQDLARRLAPPEGP